jgi:predicted O-methyltransferase YrrM
MKELKFTNGWFDSAGRQTWDQMIPKLRPQRILEVGSFEGASTCYLIQKLSDRPLELHCIDTWEGGTEHISEDSNAKHDMSIVKQTFDENMEIVKNPNLDLYIHQGYSHIELAKLLVDGYIDYFDFIYIDGSHESPDVLCDAVMAFKLLKLGGVMVFDDYLWHYDDRDLYRCPKMAIDSFATIYWRKLEITTSLSQLIIQKFSN